MRAGMFDQLWTSIADAGRDLVRSRLAGRRRTVQTLCRDLLSTRGEASGAALARELVDEARRVIRLMPEAIRLDDWLRQAEAESKVISEAGVDELTPAELRILFALPSHYSLPDIAARAHVSPNTVKTQAQAIYRKLGVSSRRDAVERARVLGLLRSE